MPDSTLSTLGNIRTKIRRITRSPSITQITDAQIDEYVNTFILYDFPEHLKLFSLRRTFSFYTKPYIDKYTTNTTDPNDPMYNFKNKYTSIHKQVAIAGYPAFVSLSRDQFYGIYPRVESIKQIATGDSFTTAFAGTLSSVPLTRGEVVFSSVDINSNGLVLKDIPIANSPTGNLVIPDSAAVLGTINYITGVYTFMFLTAPLVGAAINSQTRPINVSRPQAILYYDDEFIVRPVPDQPYRVDLECYCRPAELLDVADVPDLSEWWQYIAYGSAKKIFEDRLDEQSAQVIFPEFKQQELLVLRRTIMNSSNERTATIYTEQVDLSSGISGWGGNNV